VTWPYLRAVGLDRRKKLDKNLEGKINGTAMKQKKESHKR
jgi:hypothetical protein